MRRIGNQGFTLIELVVAITLLAAMMAILTGGFSLSLRSWEAGTERMERHFGITEGLYLITGRVKEARPVSFVSDRNVKTLAFIGSGGTLVFVTARPRLTSAGDATGLYLHKVEFNVDKKAVVYSEAPFYPHQPPEEIKFVSTTFGEGKVEGLFFEYEVRDPMTTEEKYLWLSELDYFKDPPSTGKEQGMPRAVRIRLVAPDARDPFTVPEVTVPILPGIVIKKEKPQ